MKKKKTILSLLFLAVLMGATYFVLEKCGRELNFSQMAQFISNGNKLYLALALLNMVLFILLEAVSLRSIYRHLGQDTGFWPSIIYSTSDIYFSAITPSAAGGQPASAFYMVRDGMPVSVATSALLLNIVCYTASLDIIGVFTLLTNVEMFLGFDLSVQLLILLGIGIQFVLLIFFVLCMYKSHVVYKVCSGGLGLLARLNIVHNREVLEQKLRKTIDQYALCIAVIAQRKWLPVKVLLLNLSQRAAQILITCFVCMSAPTGLSFLSVMAKQAFCMTGSNSVPLPGAVGAYEFLYIGVFGGGLGLWLGMTLLRRTERFHADDIHDDSTGDFLLSLFYSQRRFNMDLSYTYCEKVSCYAWFLQLWSDSYISFSGQLCARHTGNPEWTSHHPCHCLSDGFRLSGCL